MLHCLLPSLFSLLLLLLLLFSNAYEVSCVHVSLLRRKEVQESDTEGKKNDNLILILFLLLLLLSVGEEAFEYFA